MELPKIIQLAALVETDLGEGFVVGLTPGAQPNYGVRLMDGTMCDSYSTGPKRFSKIKLIDNYPIDHPKLPPGLRAHIQKKLPKS